MLSQHRDFKKNALQHNFAQNVASDNSNKAIAKVNKMFDMLRESLQ